MTARFDHRDTRTSPSPNTAYSNNARTKLQVWLAEDLAQAQARGRIGVHTRTNSSSGGTAGAFKLEADD